MGQPAAQSGQCKDRMVLSWGRGSGYWGIVSPKGATDGGT